MRQRTRNILLCFGTAALFASCSPSDPSGLVGQTAKDFTVSPVSPKGDIKLSDLKGKVVILDFWATFCGPCKMLMPAITQLQEKYGKENLVVLGISAEDRPTVAAFRADHPEIGYELCLDKQSNAHALYKAEGLPTTVIIGRDGKVLHWEEGYSEPAVAELEKQVADAVAAKA